MTVHGLGYGRKPRPSYALDLVPLDELVARIEAIRAEAVPPTCPTCGSTAATRTQVCTGPCEQRKALAFFRTRPNGTPYRECLACEAARTAVARRRRAISALRRAS